MTLELSQLVADVAAAIKRIDARRPQAVSSRIGGSTYQPGFGPYSETQAVQLVRDELEQENPGLYRRLVVGVPYPALRRQKCDLCLGESPNWEWAIEFKLLRMMGDNGKPNANMLMHILSPYPVDRSALTDCVKLAQSDLTGRRAVVIYGFDFSEYPLDPAIDAFETLARARVVLGPRNTASFDGLVHPVHRAGRVFGWEILAHAA